MKRKILITSTLAAAMTLAGCGQPSANETEQAFCVDRNGNAVNPDFCDDDDSSGSSAAMFMLMGAMMYQNQHPAKYNAAKRSYSKMGYSTRSVSRGIAGTSARSFSVGG